MLSDQGVREHTFMFKSIEDAQALRQRVCECFERAALPGTSDKVSPFSLLCMAISRRNT